jgi:hypothetical protein
MDGQATRCPGCGTPASSGRFCSQCGTRLESVPDAAAYDDTSTHDRIPVVPAAPTPARPLFRDEVEQPATRPTYVPPAPAAPAYVPPAAPETTYLPVATEPDYSQPSHAAPSRRSPGVGLWIAAAAGLVVVLVAGAFLLLGGTGDDKPSSSRTPPLIPQSHPASKPTRSPTTSAPTSASTATKPPSGAATDVAGLAQASAPSHAPEGVDFAGRPVTFVAPNMVDGAADTCWRTPGDATHTVLTFRLDQPTVITEVGLINGYAKTVFPGGRRFDWYHGDRRVLSVDWVFDDGTTVSQQFSDSRTMQTMPVAPVTTSSVQVRITAVSGPGHGKAARNDTAISEVSLVGRTA